MNKWLGVGRLTKDVDLRFLSDGKGVASFTVAINRPFKSKSGDKEADFINVVSFRNAENIANFVRKGSLVGVEGRIQSRSYDNNEGKRVFVTEVVADSVQFLEPKSKPQSDNGGATAPTINTQHNDPFQNDGTPIDIDDSSLPF